MIRTEVDQLPVYLSTGAFKTRELEAILDQAEELGITHVELSSGVAYAPDLMRPVRERHGRIEFLVHNYFPPPDKPFVLNLAALDQDTLALSVEHCRRAIDLAAELGAPFYSVHSGFALRIRPEMLGRPDVQRTAAVDAYEAAYATFVESLKELCAHSARLGVGLLIENNVLAPELAESGRGRSLLMARADEITRVMQDVAHPALGLLVDTGHAKVSGTALGFTPESFVEEVAPFIRAFHLSDNDGLADQNLGFDDGAWFAPFLGDFPEATLVVEAYKLTPEEMRSNLAMARALQGRTHRGTPQ